jgi:hypothetical protein
MISPGNADAASIKARADAKQRIMEILGKCADVVPGMPNGEDRAYVLALRLVATEALHALEISKPSKTSTWHGGPSARSILDGLPAPALGDFSVYEGVLEAHRCGVVSALNEGRVASEPELANAIGAAGIALSHLLVRCARREIEGKLLERLVLEQQCQYGHEMRRALALETGWGLSGPERFHLAFKKAVESKRSMTGQVPRLVLVHDVDRNLTPNDDHYEQFPHYRLFSRVQLLHRELDLGSAEARFAVLSIFGASHRNVGEIWHSRLRAFGHRMPDLIFDDARELLGAGYRLRDDYEVVSTFVTGNSTVAVAQMASSLGLSDARVWGIDERRVDGFNKSVALWEIIHENPGAVVVVSDDGDPELIESVRRTISCRNRQGIGLADLVFFVARAPNEVECNQFPLREVLEEEGLPYLTNVCEPVGHARGLGYQGMSQVVDWYESYQTL